MTYSFNPGIEDMNIIIQNCLDSGSDNLELMGNHVETTMGMPRSKRSHAEWRSNVSMKDFKNVKKQFKIKALIFLHISHIVWGQIIRMVR